MEYRFTNDKSLYLQIMDLFKCAIVSGEYLPGSKVESVRDLAVQAQVNPNTMQKALSELEREGLVKSERTSGRFITDDLEKIAEIKNQLAKSEISKFLEKMNSLEKNSLDYLTL